MEKRKDSISFLKICRFCLAQNKSLGSLYEKNKHPNNTVCLSLKILSCTSIEIFPSDKMPTYICERCKFFMNMFYDYKNIVRQADEAIMQYLQNGASLASINWPLSLNKIFRNTYDSGIVNTIVEDGTTVQVTSHDISDSDDEDANVYNVKIGDDEETKTCIKVVTSKENNEKEDARDKDSGGETDKTPEKEKEKCWPCDECDCTYPLQQLLDLHKLQKHRTRNVECDQCDAKFFSKYDLATHQLRHSDETPFQCVACGKKFKRLILLKRHERMIHSDLPQQTCPNCPATFLSIEELEMHQKRHVRVQKPYTCHTCDKKFYEKSTLQRHQDVVHNKAATFCCEYCPERFGSISKLARHVRSHAGERPYPCKYCDKSFTKSHHYTRHLRVKHRETIRTSRVSLGPAEQFRCEQCEDVFDSQDDLIYHSAIHATQNLTCPLCQEKFEDVEAVTAHIKSHVNGIEFMCDYCELIFTTKEKLDSHLLVAHEDEIQGEIIDESSLEMEADDDDDDNVINVKEDGDDMIIEIKKPDNFLVANTKDDSEDKLDNTNSEESESEATYTELSTVDTLAILSKDEPIKVLPEKQAAIVTASQDQMKREPKLINIQTANIVRKAEEIKRKSLQTPEAVKTKREQSATKVESSNSSGTSDKSLRLLEKELQDLKRTNSRSADTVKTPMKILDTIRSKRQLQTPTPKLRSSEEKKQILTNRSISVEKKQPEKRLVTKENKEPKESKEPKINNGNGKEDKDTKEKEKENGEKDKGRETPKAIIKNGSANDKATDEGVRRSTRPSKIKDYAKMIRDRSHGDSEDDDETTEDDEDYQEPDKNIESRRGRRPSQPVKLSPVKPTPTSSPSPANPPRKRGRPRKEPKEVPAKIMKENEDTEEEMKVDKNDTLDTSRTSTPKDNKMGDVSSNTTENVQSDVKPREPIASPSNVLLSPTGQPLKKIPIKALPPGVKPLPLPANARTLQAGELCQMQIGKKVVKVQKIVMTKAEVEAMAKKGLVEMKDGTMVLKQGIKLPTSDVSAVKSSLVGDAEGPRSKSELGRNALQASLKTNNQKGLQHN